MPYKDREKQLEAQRHSYHRKKEQGEKRSKVWICVFYPESAPKNWAEIIRSWQIEVIVSPLHDSDTQPDGSLKKAHWHAVLIFDSLKSQEQVEDYTKDLNGPRPQWARGSKRNCVAYLIHANDPDKFQYSSNDIQEFGGASFKRELERPDEDWLVYNSEMVDFCLRYNVLSFATLSRYALKYRPDWAEALMRRSTYYIKEILKTLYQEKISPKGAYGTTFEELEKILENEKNQKV